MQLPSVYSVLGVKLMASYMLGKALYHLNHIPTFSLILFDSEVWSLFQWLLALLILPLLTLLESTVCLHVCVCVMWCGVPVLGRQKARIVDRLGADLSLCCDSATPSPFRLLKTTVNYLLPSQQEIISLIFFLFLTIYICLSVGRGIGVTRGQKSMLGSLKLELQLCAALCSCWEPNKNRLQKQFTPSIQSISLAFLTW